MSSKQRSVNSKQPAHSKQAGHSEPSTTPMATSKEFRCIPKGAGGTLVVNNENGIRRIGTLGCDQSLGVFFRIDAQRIFCAHMCVNDVSKPISEAQGSVLRDHACRKLEDLAKKEGWAIENEDFGWELMLLCRQPTSKGRGGKAVKGPGWWMVQGVHKFMDQCLMDLLQVLKTRPAVSRAVRRAVRRFDKPSGAPDISAVDEATAKMEDKATRLMLQLERLDGHDDECAKGFVIDAGPKLEVMMLEREEKHALNLTTRELDSFSYVPKEEVMRAGEWCFPVKGARY